MNSDIIFVSILVEGQTEETFVSGVLGKYLLDRGIQITPIIVTTRRSPSGKKDKGGVVPYEKIVSQIRNLIKPHIAVVTTMFDFYQLPNDFPKYDQMPNGTCYAKVQHLEKAFEEHINNPKFLPYIAIHEFEALLFVSPEKIVGGLTASNTREYDQTLVKINGIKEAFHSPEEINENNPPSKRLKSIYSSYEKVTLGCLIAEEIGIDAMRKECSHFDEWLDRLENFVGKKG
jgi:hypothetical protein